MGGTVAAVALSGGAAEPGVAVGTDAVDAGVTEGVDATIDAAPEIEKGGQEALSATDKEAIDTMNRLQVKVMKGTATKGDKMAIQAFQRALKPVSAVVEEGEPEVGLSKAESAAMATGSYVTSGVIGDLHSL